LNALKNWKVQNIALLLLVSSGIVLTMVAAFVDYQIHRKVMMEGIDDRLYAAATFAEQILPDDYHDRIVDRNALSPEEFSQIVDRYNQLCEKLGLQYLWSLMLIDGHPVFTSSTSPDKTTANGNHAKFFEKHSNPELYEVAFETMQPQYQVNHDKWGTLRAALIPNTDSQGRKYLFGASMSVSVVETYISNLWKYSLIMVTLFFPAALFMIFLSQRLSAPIELLADAAERVGSGDYTSKIDISGAREINVVSQHLEAMRDSVLNHVTQLNNSMAELRSLEQIISNSPVIVYRLRMEPGSWPVEFITENISLMGYAAEALLSGKTTWHDINYPEDIPVVEEKIKTFMNDGSDDFYIESRLVTADGSIRHMECWNRFVRDSSGKEITHIHGLLKDVTALTVAKEKEARNYKELEKTITDLQAFESVVNASPFTAFKLNVQHNFKAEYVSENIATLGYNARDFINGKKDFASIVPPDSLKRLRKRFTEAVQSGEDTYTLETTIMGADGEVHPCLNSYRIINDKQGAPLFLQGLSADMSEQKNAEHREETYQQQIQEKIEELENIHKVVANSSIHIYRVKLDEDFTTEFITDNYSLMGYDPDDLRTGKIKWKEIMLPEDSVRGEMTLLEKLEEGVDSYALETRLRWANAEVHWYRCWNKFIMDEQENPVAIQGIMMDVTDLKKAHERDVLYQKRLKELAQELVQAEDKERRDLAYILHDDIGQMLAGLNMKLSVLQEADKDHSTELFGQITELVDRIMKTTKSLTWEISPTSLYETDIAAGLERMAADLHKFFDLEITIETAGVRIELDRDTAALIFRMAKELLVNIAKHSGTKSADIGISQYNNKVHMVVSDLGTGFDPEKLRNGKGYGLFSIKERLEHINGSMHIDSVPGKGTHILMIIPMDISTIS
jgi:PAS domain S-box-containing protein